MKTLLFVYGTLLKGLRLHHHLGQATFIENAKLRGELYDVGTYPGLILNPACGWVLGELYEVNDLTLQKLDEVEDYYPDLVHDSEYLRSQVKVLTNTHVEVSAQTYIYNKNVNGLKLIATGNYAEYLRN